jgi:hypothetical protein
VSDSQIRGFLVQRGIFIASAPRQAPKKGGKRKADFIAEVVDLVGEDMPSMVKMTIADIETLIGALKKGLD